MKPLLVFDLDGTLIDSARDIANAVNIALLNHGKMPVDYSIVVSHIGEGLRGLLVSFFPEYLENDEMLNKIEQSFLKIYDEEMLKETHLYPGVFDFLNNWQGQMGIITNKRIDPTRILVKPWGFSICLGLKFTEPIVLQRKNRVHCPCRQ